MRQIRKKLKTIYVLLKVSLEFQNGESQQATLYLLDQDEVDLIE